MRHLSLSSRPSRAALLVLIAAVYPVAAAAQSCELRSYPRLHKTLGNGLRVTAVQTPLPNVVSLQIAVETRPATENGLPHLVERLLRRGTSADSAARYDELLARASARQTASTSDDRTTYQTTFTKADVERILEAEAERFQNFTIDHGEFREEVSAVQAEYRRASQNPLFRLFETQREKAFTSHPYRYGMFGSRRSNLGNQYAAAKTFGDQWYRPEHTSVTVVGDIDPETATRLVEKFFGDWQRGSSSVTPERPKEPEPRARVVEHVWWKDETPAWVTVAFHSPRYGDDSRDYAAIDLLLEAYFGAGSELYRRLVVDEEKVDLLGTDLPAAADPHLATIYARLRNKNDLVYVRDLILATMARAKSERLASAALEAVKANRHYTLLSEMESTEGVAAVLSPWLRQSEPFADVSRYACRRASLTAADVHEVASKYLIDSRLVITTLSHALRQLPLAAPPTIASAAREPAPAPATAARDFPIVVLKTTGPIVETKLVFTAGSGRDPLGKEGLAALAAAMLAEGHPRSRSAAESRNAFYAAGGSMSVEVEKERVTYTIRSHRDGSRRAIDAAVPLVVDPALDRADFLTLRRRQQEAIDRLVVDEVSFSRELLQRRVFFGQPYAHPVVGSDDGIATITLRDVRAFIAAHYRTGNLTVGISGDAPDDLVRALREQLGRLPAGGSPPLAVKALGAQGIVIDIFEDPGAEKTSLSIGYPITVTREHADFPALSVAATILGDPESDGSRLHDRIVIERGLANIAAARIEQTRSIQQRINDPLALRRESLFEINLTAIDSRNTNMAIRVALFELKKLVDGGVTEAEFARAREILIKEIARVEGDSSRLLGDELEARLNGGRRWAGIRESLARLTAADVNGAIRKHLHATNVLVSIVTKEAREQRLELRKPVASAVTYAEAKPKALLDEDAAIAAMSLDLETEDVRYYTMQDLQEQGW